jgi:AcrR family transcriptional regulator
VPYRPTARTEARRLQDRDRILRSAQALIARGGFRAASVAQVARRSRLAVGSVYRHFPSKAELFAEVFRRASGHEVEVTGRAGEREGSCAERLTAVVETFARRAFESPRLAYALLAEPVDPAVEAERLIYRRAYRDRIERVLAQGVRAGELPALDPKLCAAAIVGAIAEALVGPLSQGGSRSRDALVAELARFVVRSVSPLEEKRHVASVRSRRTA